MSSLLTDIVRKQTATSLLGVFSRTVDKVVEEMAHDLLRDPEFRTEIQQLVRVAFQQTLKELNDPTPPDSEPRRSDADLWRLVLEQRDLIATMRKKTPPSEPPP